MVPRKPVSSPDKKFTMDFVFSSLNTPPIERTSWQIDSITNYFMNSPEFLKIAKNKREIRELSKNVELEFYNPNSILFSIGDSFDGVYFIFKGQVAFLREKEDITNSFTNAIKLPSGPNNSVRQNRSYDLDYRRENQNSHQDFFYNDKDNTNISSTSTSDDTDSFSLLHLSSHQRTEIQTPSYPIPLITTHLLESRFGIDKKFEIFELKSSNSIIGFHSNEIKRQKPWSFTAIVTEPSYIIRIESSIYRKTIAYLRTEEQLNIAKFLEEIIEFDPILYKPELLERMSQVMKTIFIPKGTKRLPIQFSEKNDDLHLDNCWYVIKSGSIGRYRKVNFDQITIDQRALFLGSIKIKIPKGTKLIKTDNYGPKRCLADSSLSKSLNKPYELKFLEDTVVHAISYSDVKDIIPYNLRKQIERSLLDDPSEDELIRSYCEKEMQIQWQIYRHKISKEAKLFALNEKIMMTGEVTCRRPSPPKQIKDHQNALKNPRFHAKREIEKMKERTNIEFAPSFRILSHD